MKKFCIVSFGNMYMLPYAKIYVNKIIESGNNCTLLFWDRDGNSYDKDLLHPECKIKSYFKEITPKTSKVDKLNGYFGATHYIRKDLKQNNYDGIIFLQTHSAVACIDILKHQYKNKYIIDIRDYSLENFRTYCYFEKRVVDNSYKAIISSPAYQKFLPKSDYILAHNYTPFSDEVKKIVRSKIFNDKGPINISFVGTVRFIDMDKKILKLFANDDRFKINYFGNGSQVLADYCHENSINNVEFRGAFSQEETTELYKSTDIINNLYGNKNPFLDYALSNKLYHAAQFYMPILVCPGTYMEEVSNKYNLGFTVDVNDNTCPDKIFEWYNSIDRKKLNDGCEQFIKKVEIDNEKFYNTCDEFIIEV